MYTGNLFRVNSLDQVALAVKQIILFILRIDGYGNNP
jgi:hypothetical protein